MYLGDRFECLFKSADSQINLRAYSRFRWNRAAVTGCRLQEKLWVF
jgi:iron(III) transport system ATP-binding protein